MDEAIRKRYENLGAGRLTRDIVLPSPFLAMSNSLTCLFITRDLLNSRNDLLILNLNQEILFIKIVPSWEQTVPINWKATTGNWIFLDLDRTSLHFRLKEKVFIKDSFRIFLIFLRWRHEAIQGNCEGNDGCLGCSLDPRNGERTKRDCARNHIWSWNERACCFCWTSYSCGRQPFNLKFL